MEESDAQAKTHLPSNSDIRESEPTNFKTNVLKLLHNINLEKGQNNWSKHHLKMLSPEKKVHQVSIF